MNQSLLTPCLSFHTKHLGTSVGNLNVMTFFVIGKWLFKLQMARETTFLIFLILISTSSNHFILKKNLGYSCLITQTHYVCMWLELLLIMHLSVNIDLDSSLGKNLSAHVAYIQLNYEDIFFMIVEDSMAIRIWEEIFLVILLGFWRLILTLLLS